MWKITAFVAGLLSSIVYVTIDLLSASRYPGYSLVHQAISELSAIGAPTASAQLWSLMGPTYGVLFIAFAIAIIHAGRDNPPLRTVGWLLVVFVAWNVLWPVFPMHPRGAERNFSDIGHLVLGAGCEILILSFIAFGSVALGSRFMAFSLIAWSVELLTAIGTFMYVPYMDSGATPWLGVVERIMIYTYLLWIAVLAFALIRRQQPAVNVAAAVA